MIKTSTAKVKRHEEIKKIHYEEILRRKDEKNETLRKSSSDLY